MRHDRSGRFSDVLLVGLLVAFAAGAPTWAALAKLVRQEIRETSDGGRVLVCIYAAGDREIERVYPIGNFCPQYVEA